jgi:hypothetical protein
VNQGSPPSVGRPSTPNRALPPMPKRRTVPVLDRVDAPATSSPSRTFRAAPPARMLATSCRPSHQTARTPAPSPGTLTRLYKTPGRARALAVSLLSATTDAPSHLCLSFLLTSPQQRLSHGVTPSQPAQRATSPPMSRHRTPMPLLRGRHDAELRTPWPCLCPPRRLLDFTSRR